MKRIALIGLVVLAVLSVSLSVAAQSDCATWGDLAYSVFDRYNSVREGRDIQTAAQLQALRREVEAFDIDTCPAGQELYDSLIQLLNLSADSVVAGLADDPILAGDLGALMINVYFKTAQLVVAGIPTVVAQITDPVDGAEIERYDITVEGTYDPEALGEETLWVFTKSPQQVYFPQVVDGCNAERRTSVSRNPQRQTWSIPGFLGTEANGIGDTFEIILFTGGQDAQDLIYDYFETACASNRYTGMTADEVYAGPLTEIDFIRVTRTG